ncbi:MAG: hypothetical protein IJY04_07335 [Clostridia bacterium]|nr:hypothetical protein [Clostridia bacterium]
MPNLSELFLYNGEIRLEFIIWPIFLGVCIGAFITVFVRVKLGEVVRAIFAKGACSPETACTLEELGVSNRFFIRASLRGKSALRRVVSAVDCSRATGADAENVPLSPIDINEKLDLDTCRFYISDEHRERAESLYDDTNSTVLSAVIAVLLALVIAAVSMFLVPVLMDMFDGMVDSFRGK